MTDIKLSSKMENIKMGPTMVSHSNGIENGTKVDI